MSKSFERFQAKLNKTTTKTEQEKEALGYYGWNGDIPLKKVELERVIKEAKDSKKRRESMKTTKTLPNGCMVMSFSNYGDMMNTLKEIKDSKTTETTETTKTTKS